MWSPQMIGVLPLQEGSGVFQTMFSFVSAFQFVGRPVESLTPFPLGPRHCGQFSVAPETEAIARRIKLTRRRGGAEKYIGYMRVFLFGRACRIITDAMVYY